jgi:hypothetical protein
MAAFCNPMPVLWTPKFVKYEANSPKVSRHYRENSRFGEIGGGDRGRSVLVGRAYSANSSNSPALPPGNWEFGARTARRSLQRKAQIFRHAIGAKYPEGVTKRMIRNAKRTLDQFVTLVVVSE